MDKLTLMCVFAHPDDETMGAGGLLARYAAEGVETYVICATRGERGWGGPEHEYPGSQAFGKVRETELMAAARVLGVREVSFLDYIDGDLDQANPPEAISKIVGHIRRVRPQVVVTFPPDGTTGHPDHIAISQFTAAAAVCAADSGYPGAGGLPPHRLSKLYYQVDSKDVVGIVQSLLGDVGMEVDGAKRPHFGWEEWAITTRLDCTAYWRTVLEAVYCHQSQIISWKETLDNMPVELHQRLWCRLSFYRAYSLVNGGRKVETDLFEGLR